MAPQDAELPMEELQPEDELGSTTKGKRGELVVIGELLRMGLEVFTPIVDSGIDCLVKVAAGAYREIQIKYRENQAIFSVRGLRPRPGFFIICYLKGHYDDHMWVVPSSVFFSRSRSVQVRGRETRQLIVGKEGSSNYEALRVCDRNFNQLLREADAETKKAVGDARRRIREPHFGQKDLEREILVVLSKEKRPLRAQEIVERLEQALGDRFTRADLEADKGKMARWEKTARFALYQGLKRQGLIEAATKNQWVITAAGSGALNSH